MIAGCSHALRTGPRALEPAKYNTQKCDPACYFEGAQIFVRHASQSPPRPCRRPGSMMFSSWMVLVVGMGCLRCVSPMSPDDILPRFLLWGHQLTTPQHPPLLPPQDRRFDLESGALLDDNSKSRRKGNRFSPDSSFACSGRSSVARKRWFTSSARVDNIRELSRCASSPTLRAPWKMPGSAHVPSPGVSGSETYPYPSATDPVVVCGPPSRSRGLLAGGVKA